MSIENKSLATAQENSAVVMGFGSLASFEFMQRTAKMFSASSMVPSSYRAVIEKGYGDNVTYHDNPAALPNCVIALNMAQRMNSDPLMIMQNLHVIEGRPSWSSQFIIAAINSCGRYSPLRFDLVEGEEMDAEYTTYEWENKRKVAKTQTIRIKDITCVAWAIENGTKQRLESSKISIAMAVAEGWYGKNGSKWRTMPEQMLRYRAASFFGRIYAPELLMGLPSVDETLDIIDVVPQGDGTYAVDLPQAPKEDPRPPVSKSEAKAKTAQAKSDTQQQPEDARQTSEKVTDVNFKEVKADEASATQNQPLSTEGTPLTDTEFNYLNMKLEESALSSVDFEKKFGFDPKKTTQEIFKEVLAWVKNPAA